ncbi:MAG: imelysin family protein, partial [Anaerolineae bacterium]|nr:imelysin family protein [Anaerolineae bacterium]
PTEDGLQALQDGWRSTALLWEQLAPFRLGRAFVAYSHIANETPPNVDFIEALIAEATPIDAAYIDTFGSNMVGLRTLEYLIFDSGAPGAGLLERFTAGQPGEQRRNYVVAVTDMLRQDAATLLEMWSPDGQNYLRTFIVSDNPTSVRQSTSLLVNEMLYSLENVVQMSLFEPLGSGTGVVRPVAVPAPYSGLSLPLIRSYFESLRAIYTGSYGDVDGLGLDDYLASLDAAALAETIDSQIDAVLAAIDAVETPMATALEQTPEQITAIYDQARALVTLMKLDLISRLGLTITFSDSDGD